MSDSVNLSSASTSNSINYTNTVNNTNLDVSSASNSATVSPHLYKSISYNLIGSSAATGGSSRDEIIMNSNNASNGSSSLMESVLELARNGNLTSLSNIINENRQSSGASSAKQTDFNINYKGRNFTLTEKSNFF